MEYANVVSSILWVQTFEMFDMKVGKHKSRKIKSIPNNVQMQISPKFQELYLKKKNCFGK